ncbi:sensor histidine kinase [Streptomyces collinus]|uniref:histidine kinase n=1 Tax=Streptomyces collinus (strain DSM 40733 / Tue 365) TaxID=1214242 RepID=S5UME4_STRC3|nr:histidine kinase [Streptomyces collinus]AGS68143.1 two-component system sensor kinase [Streptomyces collinus Tu 365]UJA06783.1 two-component sensor histidine kinase [Streptomyces collinus]UJA12047.1 two-component sensor histidine kinase [Streptomyces collinus]UJA13087.1 two-component sensor histidine kinase [Streptomyces collinus]UJA18351.1 two-component sensor histidine kinase [Streptomyces collinus]
MARFLRPLLRGTTYTRLLHLWVPMLMESVWLFIDPSKPWVPALVLVPVGLLPAVRVGEGVQARLLLTPDTDGTGISVTPSASWRDRGRTVLWLELRMLLAVPATFASVWLPVLTYALIRLACGYSAAVPVLDRARPHWAYGLLAPLPLLVLYGLVVGFGALATALARRLLGPSAAERLAALEERTEQLLERTRIARELHDSIGHALTVAVVQAGAARAAGDPEFTGRALVAIEETGRAALEDLERVLGVLRESERPASSRPTLADADRLLDSARASGAEIDAEVSGPVAAVPGPVSREGYRILQEALTNVLRHAGAVPARVRVAVADGTLVLEVRNPLDAEVPAPGRGSGLRGIRERAALLGGDALTGPYEGDWRVRAELPLG